LPQMNEFLIVQGPLYVDWSDWRFIYHPTIDDGQITEDLPPSPHRFDKWLENSAYVKGKESWRFIKVYTHGAHYTNAKAFTGSQMDSTLSYVEAKYGDGKRFRLHYVTAREVHNIILAAVSGMEGNPGQYRDFPLRPYDYSDSAKSAEK